MLVNRTSGSMRVWRKRIVGTSRRDRQRESGSSRQAPQNRAMPRLRAAPILTRIETNVGHGAGKPTAKVIEERADILAFLVKSLSMRVPE